MGSVIGIRREDKNKWEKRVPLAPSQVKEIIEKTGARFIVQPSAIRIFHDGDYRLAGAEINEDLSECSIIMAVKEIPQYAMLTGKIYISFSHTIKGQPHNMPGLKKLMELGCSLLDYERIVDEKGNRLLFFGRYAGLAGMIDTLWALGKRLGREDIKTDFSRIAKAVDYKSLDDAFENIREIGRSLEKTGLPETLAPLVCAIAGNGRVSKGAQEILSLLPVEEVNPREIKELFTQKKYSTKKIYKAVFNEEDMVAPAVQGKSFNLQDYYKNPQHYKSVFSQYLPYMTMLVNCIYWDAKYPRLAASNDLRELFSTGGKPRLKVIGDLSCDIKGAIEATVRTTDSGQPVFTFNPFTEKETEGWEGEGVVVLAVDNLPCELPAESSTEFGKFLLPLMPGLIKADFSADFEKLSLPAELKRAMILYRGSFTEPYSYMNQFVQ